MKSRDFDFDRAKSLMELIVEAGKHGPLYQKISGWAGEELKEMMREVEPDAVANPRVVTPAAGPANGLVEQKDGSYARVQPAPLPVGVRDEAPLAGEVSPVNPANAPARTDQPLDETRVPEARQGMSIPTGNQALPAERVARDEEARGRAQSTYNREATVVEPTEPLVPAEPIDRRL